MAQTWRGSTHPRPRLFICVYCSCLRPSPRAFPSLPQSFTDLSTGQCFIVIPFPTLASFSCYISGAHPLLLFPLCICYWTLQTLFLHCSSLRVSQQGSVLSLFAPQPSHSFLFTCLAFDPCTSLGRVTVSHSCYSNLAPFPSIAAIFLRSFSFRPSSIFLSCHTYLSCFYSYLFPNSRIFSSLPAVLFHLTDLVIL